MFEIDFHSHQHTSDAKIQILNVFAQDLPVQEDNRLYSAGLHPWHLGLVNPDDCLQSIELAATKKNVIAIGECGLDKSINTDMIVQNFYLKKQIGIAEKHSKPLIIHCVRAFPELIKIKNETKSSVPWIIHGFQGKLAIAGELIRNGFYLSVGESLLANQQKTEVLKSIPPDRLFFETDNRETSITKLYQLASQALTVDEETLGDTIFRNFRHLFGAESAVYNYLT